jgi:DNA polymerase III alpha subunit (gram-positive type)
MDVAFTSRPIAVTDVETTGVEPDTHEIIEIGLILVDQASLTILDTLDVKVKPQHIERASATALTLNGYNQDEWRSAMSLQEAMSTYAEKTINSIFCSQNVTFDWSFIQRAFKLTGVTNSMDYHRLDLFTASWVFLRGIGFDRFNLDVVAEHLKIGRESYPHRAIGGARTAYEVLKRLLTCGCQIEKLPGGELGRS